MTFFYIMIITLFLAIAETLVILQIKRNKDKLKLKSTIEKTVEARIRDYRIIPGGPRLYFMDVEYEEENEKHRKRLWTRGRFALKYEHKDSVPIVIIPDTGKVYFYEETWKEVNLELLFLAVWIGAFLTGAFIICFIGWAMVFSIRH